MKQSPPYGLDLFLKIGKIVFELFSSIGNIILFFLDCLKYLFLDKFYHKMFLQH